MATRGASFAGDALNTLVALHASRTRFALDTLRSLDRAAGNPLDRGRVVDPERIVRLDDVGIALRRAGWKIALCRHFALEVDAETGRALDTLRTVGAGRTGDARFALDTLATRRTRRTLRTRLARVALHALRAGRTLVALRPANRNPGYAVKYQNVLSISHSKTPFFGDHDISQVCTSNLRKAVYMSDAAHMGRALSAAAARISACSGRRSA